MLPGNAYQIETFSLYSRRRFFRLIIIFKILNNLNCPVTVIGIFNVNVIGIFT